MCIIGNFYVAFVKDEMYQKGKDIGIKCFGQSCSWLMAENRQSLICKDQSDGE